MGSCLNEVKLKIQKNPPHKTQEHKSTLENIPVCQKKYGIKNQKSLKTLKFQCAPLINNQFLYNKFHHDSSRPDELNLQWQIEKVQYDQLTIKIWIINFVPVNLWLVVGGKEKKNMTGLCLKIEEYFICEFLPIITVCFGVTAKPYKIKLSKKISNQQNFKIILESVADPKQTLFLLNTYSLHSSEVKLTKQELIWSNLAFELDTIYHQNQQNLAKNASQIECVICKQQPSTCIFVPCKHMCLCKNCLSIFRKMYKYKICPLCKEQFTEIVVYKDVRN